MRLKVLSLLLISFACLVNINIHAQENCNQAFLGTKTLYSSPAVTYTLPPVGYSVVFINYAGRHGARHLTKAVSSTYLFRMTHLADSLNELTKVGEKIYKRIQSLSEIEDENLKSISEEGKQELAGIAERLYMNNKDLFRNSTCADIKVTSEKRTTESADAFVKGLKKKLNFIVGEKQTDDTDLRFFDMSPSYSQYEEKGHWQDSLKRLKEYTGYKIITDNICKRIFRNEFLATYNIDKEKLTNDLFGLTTIVYSLKHEIESKGLSISAIDLKPFFSCSELKCLSEIDNAEEYFKIGPGMDAGGIQVKIAVPLLIDFIKTTNDYIQSKKISLQLRFCHAETIAPFLTLMNVSNASIVAKNAGEIDHVWKASEIAPLSANLQWILFYNGSTGGYLIKFLVNEKEVGIANLDSPLFPYYTWDSVEKYYLNKLSSYNATPDSNMPVYLKFLE